MAKFKLKFEGVITWESSESQTLIPGERYQIRATLEGESAASPEIFIKEAEISLEKKPDSVLGGASNSESSDVLPHAAVVVSPIVVMDSTPTTEPTPSLSPWISDYITLEQHGGRGYYKLLEEGLVYQGNLIESASPVFTSEDAGMSFCGLFAHLNPLEPDADEYFPGIVGSRYARVIEVLDAHRIRVNFEFNGQSDKGYIFFDNSLAFRSAVNAAKLSPTKTIELQDHKTYVIPEYSKTDIGTDFFIFAKTNSNLKIGIEDYFPWSEVKRKKQDGHLFDFGGNSVRIALVNVNFIPPHRRVKAAQLFFTSLFRSTPRKEQIARVAVVNMDTTKEVNNKDPRYNQLGFGYGFMYSSEQGNYVIGKNIKHRGPGFMDFKANFGGGLNAVFENVQTDFRSEESFASPRVKVRGRLTDNVFTITSGHTIYQIYTYDFGGANVSHLLHFGRFTFVIDGKDAVISATQFKVRPYADGLVRLKVRDLQSVYAKKVELHAGDQLTYNGQLYTVVEKTRTYVTEWMEGDADTRYAMCLKLDKPLPLSSGFLDFGVQSVGKSLNDGLERDAYLIYKANYEFRTYKDTKFENWEVLSSDPVGHLSYNHKEITLWAKNFKHMGFYRQSQSHVGKTNGYTLINSEGFEGQFNPEVTIASEGEMPAEARRFLDELDAKF
jgi:hypothetical protein